MNSRARLLVCLLFAAAWGLCFTQGARQGVHPAWDGDTYLTLARSIREQGCYSLKKDAAGLPVPTARYEPLQPLFLAATAFDGWPWLYLASVSLLVALSQAFWFRCARLWLGEASRMPYLLWILMLWPDALYLHARLCRREPLVCLLVAGTALLMTRAWTSGRRRDAVLAGICWGLCVLAKSVWLAPMPFLLWAWARGGRLRSQTPALLACVAVVSPWTLRNALSLHAFVPVSTGASVSFLDNGYPGMDPWRDLHPEVYRGVLKGFLDGEVAADREILRRKVAVAGSHPRLVLRILAINAMEVLRPVDPVFKPLEPGSETLLNPALLFAYAGILLGLWRGPRLPAPDSPIRIPLALGLGYLVASLFFDGHVVYRLPAEPLLLMAGLWGWRRWSRERSLLWGASALTLCWVVHALATEAVRASWGSPHGAGFSP